MKTKDCATHEADCQQRSPPRTTEATGATGFLGVKARSQKKTRVITNPYIGGVKPSFFMVLGSPGRWWFQIFSMFTSVPGRFPI